LKEIIERVQTAGNKVLLPDQKAIGNAMKKLKLVEGRTMRVVMIMDQAS